MEYTTIQTLSSVVARCSVPLFPYSIGTRYIPRRYPCCRIPIFESACFSAFSRTRSTGNIRHYRTALCQEGIFSEAAAHLIQFPQIGSQQRIRLRFHHAAGASGARLPDSLALPQKTYELDTQTTVSAVSDLTKGLYNKDTLMQKAIEAQSALEIDVDFDKKLKQLVQKGSLLKNEGREVEKLLMNNNP